MAIAMGLHGGSKKAVGQSLAACSQPASGAKWQCRHSIRVHTALLRPETCWRTLTVQSSAQLVTMELATGCLLGVAVGDAAGAPLEGLALLKVGQSTNGA